MLYVPVAVGTTFGSCCSVMTPPLTGRLPMSKVVGPAPTHMMKYIGLPSNPVPAT